jgi:hypothetical protein
MIEQIAGYLQSNLVVFLSIVVLPLKWCVVRICRDREAESVAVLSVPEDLCYVGLGLVLGDVINSTGAFHKYFRQSSHASMNILVTLGIGLGVAFSIHLFGQWSSRHLKGWRAAERCSTADVVPKPGESEIPNASENFRTLMFRHMFLFLLGYGVQLGIVFFWLHWIAKIVSNA